MDALKNAPTPWRQSSSTAGSNGLKTAPTRLSEVLKADQSARWRRGDPILVEFYLEQHPSLKTDPEAILDLVWNEIELRQEQLTYPQPEEYVRRFGYLETQIRLLFQSPGTQVVADIGPSAGIAGSAGEVFPVLPGYEIMGELGRGGMGVVYVARQVSLKRLVALKMILAGAHADPIARKRFRTEAEAVARLVHPNIVPIFEIGEHDGRPFLCLEYVSNGNLEQKASAQALPEPEAARIMEMLARAMHQTHQHGILHRDLKPNNILLTADGVPKITDFGLAKLMDDDGGPTRTESLIGTPNYMSPEQAAGHSKNVGVTADVYSLGAILYELLTGRAPFRGPSVLNVLEQVRNREPAPPRHFRSSSSPDLETICLKCLEKEPANRYPTAEALADDLHRFLEGQPILARPVPVWQRAWRSLRRRPVLLARVAGAIALVCIVAAGFVHFRAAVTKRENDAIMAVKRDEERYRKFIDRRNEAIVNGLLSPNQGTLFVGAGAAASLQTAESAARQALELAGVDLHSSTPAVDPSLPAARRTEMAADCYILLMVLASVKAQQLTPDGNSEPQYREAVRLLDATLHFGNRTYAYHLRRASFLADMGNADEAAKEKASADSVPPATSMDFFLIGEEQYRRDRCEDALNSFNRALALQPTHFWAQFYLSVCHLKLQHWDTAKVGLNSCLTQQPRFVWAYLFRSFAHEKLLEPDNAKSDFDKALQLEMSDDERYVLLLTRGILHYNEGVLDRAEEDFQAAIRLKPDQYNAYLNLSGVYLNKGRFKQAADQVATAMRLQPPSELVFDYHLARSRCLVQAKRYDEALEDCRIALKIFPNQPLPLEVQAHVDLQFGRFEQAEELFNVYLLKRGPATPEVFRGRGKARMKLGKYPEAAEDYTRVVERAPDAEIYQLRGWAYFFADAWKLSLRDFSKAIEQAPESSDSFTGRGLSRVMLGQYQDAVTDAESALKLNPATAETFHNIACIFAQAAARADVDSNTKNRQPLAADCRDRAIKAVRKSLEMAPENERISFWHEKILPDVWLAPIHELMEFKQLKEKYTQP